MFTSNTDKDWERFGKEDPYYGVLTDERYRRTNLSQENKSAFFASGEQYVMNLWQTVKSHISDDFAPRRALDFGCGVGRLVIPFAKRIDEVTGVDVSDSMLSEARHNCEGHGLDNVILIKTDDQLSGLSGQYDFVHSLIVFQHIPVARGVKIFERLLRVMAKGAVGVMQFTYGKERPEKAWARFAKNHIPFAANVANLVRGRPFAYPDMQMNSYDLNLLLASLQRAGIRQLHVEFTNHGGELGVILYLRKQKLTK